MGVEGLLPAKGPEAGSSKTKLPDHNKHLATGRISQFVLRRLPLLGLTVLSLFSDSPPAFSQKVNNNSFNSGENTLINPDISPSEKTYQELVIPYNPQPETGVLSSLSITDTLKPVLVDREWLEKNPLTITETKDRVDASGNVIQQFVLKGGYLHESHLDLTTNQFTEFNLTSINKISMENPLTMAISADGQIILVGGENPIRSAHTALTVSYDGGKSWKSLPWPYQPSEKTEDLIRIDDNTYIGVNDPFYEGGIGQFIININRANQAVSVNSINLATVQGVAINASGARDLSVTSFDASTRRLKMIGSNVTFGQWGLYALDIDLNNNSGVLEKFNTVSIDGVQTNLGTVDTISTYVEGGRLKVVANNALRRTIYYIDLTTKTGTKAEYGRQFDNKGIPNYIEGSLYMVPVDVRVDSQGNRNTWLAGGYALDINTGYNNRLAVLHLESGTGYDFLPDIDSIVTRQKNMQRKQFKGQSGYEINAKGSYIWGLGKVFFPINPDGSPIINAPIFFPNKGLNRPYTIALPVAMSAFTSQGW